MVLARYGRPCLAFQHGWFWGRRPAARELECGCKALDTQVGAGQATKPCLVSRVNNEAKGTNIMITQHQLQAATMWNGAIPVLRHDTLKFRPVTSPPVRPPTLLQFAAVQLPIV
jgi:hypothetical protein